MEFIDVTLPLGPATPLFPGDPPFQARPWRPAADSGFAVTALQLGSHTGTHVDAPAHCFPGGAGVDALPLDLLCGEAFVWDLPAEARPPSADPLRFARLPAELTRLLLRTSTGAGGWSGAEPGGIDLATAAALVARGVRLLGIDRLSIADGDAVLPVHRFLLAHGAAIVEGLELSRTREGRYGLVCLPLRLVDGDGAPARVLLTLP